MQGANPIACLSRKIHFNHIKKIVATMTSNSETPFWDTAKETFNDAAIRGLYSAGIVSLVRGDSTRKNDNVPLGDVTVIIHFTGHRDGYFSASFSQMFADKYANIVTEEKTPPSDELTAEEIGKFASQIANDGRMQLKTHGYEIFPTSLTVIRGRNEKIPRTNKGSPILTLFRTKDGNFYLEVDF
jgi:CheY-specific phosphatase CheX